MKKPNYGAQGSFNKMKLENAEMGKVITRFPPEPSGYLHMGHVKAILLNDYYRKQYQGQMILRFDDTNPANEKAEYEHAILEDLYSINVNVDKISYTSDYFDIILTKARDLIVTGNAYVDDTSQEIISSERYNKLDNSNRNLSIEDNLHRWNEMLLGTIFGQTCVLRAKISMQHSNSALRDPALARCIVEIPHIKTGNLYKCYPTYDLAIAIVDSIEGVTHALRDSQYHARLPLYEWVQDKLNLRKVYVQEFSRINFQYTILSKRKLGYFVDNHLVENWFDPALPTIKGILNRGLTVEALTDFILSQGSSKSMTNMTMDKLWSANKKIIDPIIPRYVAISEDHYQVTIKGDIDLITKRIPLHVKNSSLGTKEIFYSDRIIVETKDVELLEQDEEFTLVDWGNAIVLNKNSINKTMIIELHLEGDYKKTKNKICWLSSQTPFIPITLIKIGNLITVPSLPKKGNDWKSLINTNLKQKTLGTAEFSLTNLKVGDKLQIMRKGYFIISAILNNTIVLVDIPDGHQ